ncbi:MAG: D-2-hydroxyacid dehydrogenase [Streptosporangiaceae bacterium]|nr:D-2-hydroxyacid dehydrogenase [Streptosporangiaceae bacterium]
MDEVNVAVIAPVLGPDLSFVSDIDPRVRVFDANFAAPGHRPRPGGEAAPGSGLLADICAQAEVLLVGYPVLEGLAAMSPRLVWAHHTQAGVSNLAGTDLWGSEVTLTSSRGAVAATAIAEYALAAAAHFARGLHQAARQKAAGQFTRQGYQMLTLRGATMGVIGLGGIGQEVARLSRAAGMRVIGTRRSVTAPLPDADGADLVLPADRILEVAADSDFLVVCSQLTAETRGFINASVFAAMKPNAVLINVARGEEVDEDALIEAVTAGRIRGAVLDVYAGELAGQPPRPELARLPQILLTPHISGGGDTHMAEPLRRLFADNLRRYLDGQPLRNVVDRARGY